MESGDVTRAQEVLHFQLEAGTVWINAPTVMMPLCCNIPFRWLQGYPASAGRWGALGHQVVPEARVTHLPYQSSARNGSRISSASFWVSGRERQFSSR